MTLRITTLIIMTFSITTLDTNAQNDIIIMKLSITVLDVMPLSIVTHILMALSGTISLKLAKCYTQHYGSHHNYIQHKDTQ
jgi:hypothetical protein